VPLEVNEMGVQMPKGYLIITEDIRDEAAMVVYGERSTPSMIEYGARVLAVEENVDVLEGEWHGTRTVVVQFESVEKAHEWYESDSYGEARPLRQAAADCNAVILSGFDMKAASSR
jgi:uncharacterized protein (DUF1330 family)